MSHPAPIRLLLVEDEPDDATLISRDLSTSPVALDLAGSLSEARAALSRTTPDCILLDLRLPDARGMEGLSVLRREAPDVPVVVLTGAGDEDVAALALSRGAQDLLVKGESRAKEILHAVRRAISRHRSLQPADLPGEAWRSAPVAGWEFVPETGEIRASDELFRLYGIDPPATRPKMEDFLSRIHPDDRARHRAAIHRTAAGNGPFDHLVRILRVDGAERIVRSRGRLLPAQTNHPAMVRGTCMDVTEVAEAERVLRESEAKFRRLFESPMVGILFWDTDGRILDANDYFLQLVGRTREEVAAGRLNWQDLTPPEHAELDARAIAEIRRTGTCAAFEKEYVHADGRRVPVLVGGALLEGRSDRGVAFALDISKQKALELQFLQAQKMEAVGRLAGGIAHDFNNLLTVILGYGTLALGQIPPGDGLKERLEEIVGAAERASELTRQLLAFSRKQILEPRVLDLNAVVGDMDKLLRRVLGEDVSLVTSLQEGLGRVKVDRTQLEQVILNLAVNARDAMPQGGKLTIETADADLGDAYARTHLDVTPGRYVLLAITDSGVGIDPEIRARIFEPFFTTKEKGKGTGLGLSTTYGIVRQSGGHIWVYSEKGRGTTFKIYFPRVDEPLPGPRPPSPAEDRRGTETILVVEDDAALRRLACGILSTHGYKVYEAADPNEALLVFSQKGDSIDLLLTDVVMPVMSGRKLADLVSPLFKRLKVLFVSGYTENAIVHHGVLDRGVPFLPKPFTPRQLLQTVRAVLEGRDPAPPDAGQGAS